MFGIARHPYFEEYIDENTGVKSYILKKKVAQLQMPFYFTAMGLTDDGKYIWFRCLNWPAEFSYLGVMSMDPDDPFIRAFPCCCFGKVGIDRKGRIPDLYFASQRRGIFCFIWHRIRVSLHLLLVLGDPALVIIIKFRGGNGLCPLPPLFLILGG